MISNKKSTKEEFIEKSKNIFGDLYNYSKVEYKGNKIKVELVCDEHGSFFIRPDTHLTRQSGCQKCSKVRVGNLNMNKNWLDNFKSVHGEKYDYSKVEYKGNKIKVEILCKQHGSFFMKPNAHVNQKQGCFKCSRKYNNKETFIEISKMMHDYDYSKVKYINSHSKVEIICKEHGSFFIRPSDHINQNQGCPKCGKISMSNKHRKNLNLLIEEFHTVHGDFYDYSMMNYINNKSKIDIICPKHGLFQQAPKQHSSGNGCPKCNSSSGEKKIFTILSKMEINFIFQHTFDTCVSDRGVRLKFDFYIPDRNICIEYDGQQHFKPIDYFGGEKSFIENKKRDEIKDKFCLSNRIKLVRIPYYEQKNIELLLKSNIL